MKKMIVIDPGHGGTDPGVIGLKGMTESRANLETALTLKHLLALQGHSVTLTRSSDVRPSYGDRTRVKDGQVCLLSVHYNMLRSYPLIYFQNAPGNVLSKRLAVLLGERLDIPKDKLWSTSQSRYKRLYIDDCKAPSVLWEVASIDKYPTHFEEAKDFRVERCSKAVEAIELWLEERGKDEKSV